MDLNEDIQQIESVIRELDAGQLNLSKARSIICKSLQKLAEFTPDSSISYAETFELIARDCSGSAKKDIGAVLIRLVCRSGLLPEECLIRGRRHIVRLIDEGYAQSLPKDMQNKKAQTHEKLESIKMIHREACDRLEHLLLKFTSLQDLTGRRQTIMRQLGHTPTMTYLRGFGFVSVHSSLSSLLAHVGKVVESQGSELHGATRDLVENVDDNLLQYSDVTTFIVQDYFLPFLQRIKNVTLKFQQKQADQFHCAIAVPVSPHELEKKYPLHVAGSQIHISVTLTNEGPGMAQNVRAYCVADHCEIKSDEMSLGDVSPGSFVLPLILKVTEPQEHIAVEVEIQWNVVGDPAIHKEGFSVVATGQRTDVDWDALSLRQPYSLEVAYETEFYGRKEAVQRILRRLDPNLMQSCYISGQKRVGKSSLSRAVESHITGNADFGNYRVLYLECGEIRHSLGEDTLKELGARLEQFLFSSLPESIKTVRQQYSSSLTPLTSLLDRLRMQQSNLRFVVILDEFDEINESLYRFGELANTFFLNLRTLSSKRNIAFILVGAERMPYVMASQGEKLNKYNRESLDSFNLETEWEDYCAMVRTPVDGEIKLHEAALRKLYELTDGHPYFTKLLCATVYESAVESKDAEVSSIEVEKAAKRVVSTLDTNAFAHYWRDGIRGDFKEIEIVSLKRCRLLVAWARTARSGKPLTCEFIQTNVHSDGLGSGEVLPLLEDSCRRRIFREQQGVYTPTVALFSVWLREGGFSRLVSDQLGDELAEAKRLREDAAYVEAEEIVNLASSWSLYQGREITEDKIRAWLGQVDSNVEQRMLFKLLQNVRFFDDLQVKELFLQAHRWIRNQLPVPVKKRRAQRREDILVSYADGPGKSGAHYAQIYARANEIVTSNVVEPLQLGVALKRRNSGRKLGVVIVDDMIGTGSNLVDKLSSLSEVFEQAKVGTDLPLSMVVVCATVEGENRVRVHLEQSMPNADLEICETLERKHYAFGDSKGFWETEEEMSRARTFVMDLGTRIQKRNPLGFNNQGLLLTFSRNCPNNTLPILHGSGKGGNKGHPLFQRMNA